MAFLIPENIPSRNDVPESVQMVAGAFRDLLEDDVTVWLEQGETPGLLVLDPQAGLLLVDAPNASTVGLRRAKGILSWLRSAPSLPDLLRTWQGKVKQLQQLLEAERRLTTGFRTAATVALPFMSAREANLPAPQVDGFLFKEDFARGRLRAAFARILRGARKAPLTESEECAVRGAIKPEIIISRSPSDDRDENGQFVFRPPEVSPEEVIRVLDREQERLAHHLHDGYQVVRGVAGSGKTLVLVFRAKHLAKHFPQQRFLLLCFNVPLSKALEQQVDGLKNVDVSTVDSFAWKHAPGPNKPGPDDFRKAREEAAGKLRQDARLPHYHAVFVDEAQDLDPAGLDLAYAALDRGRQHFVIALDGAQNVKRMRARWNPPGQTARGRTTILKRCYRNTHEIASFAWRFLKEAQLGELNEENLDDPTLIVPPELTSRRGPEPVVVQCVDPDGEADAIATRLVEAHQAGVAWANMAVLYGSRRPWLDDLQRRMRQRGIPVFHVNQGRDTKQATVRAGDVVRVATYQILKGLEFSRVFMCGVNDIYEPGGSDDATRRKLAYVGMTRAMDELVITLSGSGPIGQAILRARSAP